MNYCSACSIETPGRFCTSCGRESALSSGAMIEVSVSGRETSATARPVNGRAPGYVAPVSAVPAQSMGSTADNRFTYDAEFLLRQTGERIAWQGKPSILSIIPRAIGWGIVLLLSMAILGAQHIGFISLLAFIAALQVGAGYLNWRNTTYRITSQRVEYSRGVLSSTTAASPLIHVGNVTIVRPFPWNLLGLGHLELDIPDQATRAKNGVQPKVVLRCLQHLETTRDLIHSSSAILNQVWDQRRYGR